MRDKKGSKYITISRNFKKENIVCMERIKSDSTDEIILLSFITFFLLTPSITISNGYLHRDN